MKFLHRNWKRLTYAYQGIAHAIRTDCSYRSQVYGGAIVVGGFLFFTEGLNQTELLFLGLSWTLILITELQNSSFEAALDHMHPEMHHNIGHSKDMAAGAVLTAGLFMIFVLVMIIVL